MMTNKIHSTAIVDKKAKLDGDVHVGPFCVVGPDVHLKEGVELISHVVVKGDTVIGSNTKVFPFCSLGHQPQDLKFRGEKSRLEVGADNMIREHVTMNPGTKDGGGLTKVGNNCMIMIGAHVAHDCRIEDHVILVNNATLGGHVIIGEWAIVGGLSAVHQFVRIGKHAMIGGMSGVEHDVIPYGSVLGNRAHLQGLNLVGLRRRNFSRDVIHSLRAGYRMLFAQEGSMSERLDDVIKLFRENEPVMDVVNFIKKDSSRSICRPKESNGRN